MFRGHRFWWAASLEYSGPEKCAVGPWVTAERLGESALRVGLEFIVDQVAVAVLGLDSIQLQWEIQHSSCHVPVFGRLAPTYALASCYPHPCLFLPPPFQVATSGPQAPKAATKDPEAPNTPDLMACTDWVSCVSSLPTFIFVGPVCHRCPTSMPLQYSSSFAKRWIVMRMCDSVVPPHPAHHRIVRYKGQSLG